MTRHVFDPDSVLNRATGQPYGPGPLWAGTEPMDYPDPLCVCGRPWIEEFAHCVSRATGVPALLIYGSLEAVRRRRMYLARIHRAYRRRRRRRSPLG